MITVAIANQKGGVGKTTTAVSIAAAATRAGLRVLLVDLDSQASATQWLTNAYGPAGLIVGDVLRGDRKLSETIIDTTAGFALVPSRLHLSTLDMELFGKANGDGRLRAALATVEHRFDLVLIDAPPWLGMATLNAFVAADVVLIPIDCRAQALDAIPQLMEQIVSVSTAYARPIGVNALPTFFERRANLPREMLADIERQFDSGTLSPINKGVALAEAYVARKTIFDYAPTSTGAVDYHRVTKEFLDAILPQETRRRIERLSR